MVPDSISSLPTVAVGGAGGGACYAGRNEQEQRNCGLQSEWHQPLPAGDAVAACGADAGRDDDHCGRRVPALHKPAAGRAAQPDQGQATADLHASTALDFWRKGKNLQLRFIRAGQESFRRADRGGT